MDYKDENVWLMQGDCLERMKEIPDGSVDMVLCDLPYETTKCSWDIALPFDLLWEQYWRVGKENCPVILFGQEPFSSKLRISQIQHFKYDIYWEKERLTNIAQVKKRVGKTIETISVFYKKQCTYNPQMLTHDGPLRRNKVKNGVMGQLTDSSMKKVIEYNDTGKRYPTQVWSYKRDCLTSNLHPTQKPLALIENLINTFSNKGETVLDNCTGSGTTGVAALGCSRKFIGIEMDETYFNIAKKRILGENK